MNLFRIYLPFLLFIAMIVPTSVQASSTILVFGDSLSAGYGIERGQEWASLLKKKLQGTKYAYEVVNMSISGETTSGGLERIGAALTETRPEMLILALGANDGLRGLSMAAMKNNLQGIINQALAAKTRVILVGMHLPSNYGPAYTRLFHQQYVELARDNPVSFVPFLLENIGNNIDLFQADGVHPLAGAQPAILDNLWQTIEPLLAEHRK